MVVAVDYLPMSIPGLLLMGRLLTLYPVTIINIEINWYHYLNIILMIKGIKPMVRRDVPLTMKGCPLNNEGSVPIWLRAYFWSCNECLMLYWLEERLHGWVVLYMHKGPMIWCDVQVNCQMVEEQEGDVGFQKDPTSVHNTNKLLKHLCLRNMWNIM